MPKKLVEVARSYSEKVNLGNYQSQDFFCSKKMEVPEDEAEEASQEAFKWCYNQVQKDIRGLNPKQLFEDLKERVSMGGKLTVPEWEKLTPEQQEYFQELKRAKGRGDYADNKKVDKYTAKCPDCGRRVYVGEDCPSCDPQVVGDRYNQREVEPSELRGGDGSEE